MRSVLREKLVDQLTRVPAIIDLYQQGDSRLQAEALGWMKQCENAFGMYRVPLLGQLSGIRGLMQACLEGSGSDKSGGRVSRRAVRSQFITYLHQAAGMISDYCMALDQEFDEYREKLAQMMAVASSQAPLTLDPALSLTALRRVWDQAAGIAQNQALSAYLAYRLPETDRIYLLRDVIMSSLPAESVSA